MLAVVNLKQTATICILMLATLFIASTCRAEQEALLITPSDPLFLSTLNAEFPGLSNTEYFTQLSPYIVLLRNDGALALKAYMVEWSASTSSGGTRFFSQHYVHRFFLGPDDDRVIQPTSIRLISPLFNLSPSEYKELVGSKLLTSLYPAAILPTPVSLASINVALDGVVWMDGTFKGPNAHRSFEEYRCIRNADHDEALAVTNAAKDHTSREAILNVLEHDIASNRGEIGTQPAGPDPLLAPEYLRERARTAMAMKRMLNAEGVDFIAQRASAVAALFPSNQPTRMVSFMPK